VFVDPALEYAGGHNQRVVEHAPGVFDIGGVDRVESAGLHQHQQAQEKYQDAGPETAESMDKR